MDDLCVCGQFNATTITPCGHHFCSTCEYYDVVMGTLCHSCDNTIDNSLTVNGFLYKLNKFKKKANTRIKLTPQRVEKGSGLSFTEEEKNMFFPYGIFLTEVNSEILSIRYYYVWSFRDTYDHIFIGKLENRTGSKIVVNECYVINRETGRGFPTKPSTQTAEFLDIDKIYLLKPNCRVLFDPCFLE